MESSRLVSLYDFENKEGIFEDVHRSYRFSAIVFGGQARETERADFVFFAHRVEDTSETNKQRHIVLSRADMALFNPNTKTCPIFRTRRDADLTRSIYKRIPILIDENRKTGGNPWGLKFFTMFHQTNDAGHFQPAKVWQKNGYKLEGNIYTKPKNRALPLYEAKMFRPFDHRHGSVFIDTKNWVNQGQTNESSLVQHANPEFLVQPRWWVDEDIVRGRLLELPPPAFLAFRDVTRATDERTLIASFLPYSALVNKSPAMLFESASPRLQACLLGNLCSFACDYCVRQKFGGISLNYYLLKQIAVLPPDTYADKCPWSKKETLEHWISERVLKLSCTAEDMIPLAKACGFKGSRGDGVHLWKDAERAEIRAELDAAYFHLYGIKRDDVQYILSTFNNTGLIPENERASQQSLWGRDSTGERILDAFDRLDRG